MLPGLLLRGLQLRLIGLLLGQREVALGMYSPAQPQVLSRQDVINTGFSTWENSLKPHAHAAHLPAVSQQEEAIKIASTSAHLMARAAWSYARAASSAVSNVPSQRRAPTVGSRISAAHFPQGRWRTPLETEARCTANNRGMLQIWNVAGLLTSKSRRACTMGLEGAALLAFKSAGAAKVQFCMQSCNIKQKRKPCL